MEYLYLTEKEFVVLLSAVGRKEWEGLIDENILNGWEIENEISEILSSLYQKGTIEWENGKATILPSTRKIFDLLKEVHQYAFYARLDEEYPMEYLYVLDDKVVRARKSIHEEGKYRLSLQQLEQWEQELWENEIFPINTETFEEELPTDCPEIMADVDELIQSNIVLAFEKRKFFESKPSSRFLVKERGLYSFIYIQKEGETQVYYEEPEAVQKLFDKWIREVET